MARIRNIKPEFFLHDGLAECSPLARLLYIGLWTQADRNGVLRGHPKRLKVAVLPWDDCDVETLLGELDARGFIRRYEADGEPHIWVPKFKNHQALSGSEPAGKLPLPPDAPATGEAGSATRLQPTPNATKTNTNGKPTKAKQKSNAPAAGFEEFWIVYPLKDGKQKAAEAWSKLGPDESLRAVIVADVRRRSSTLTWKKDDRVCGLHASTYLNQKRWTDEPSEALDAAGKVDDERAFAAEQTKRRKAERLAEAAA